MQMAENEKQEFTIEFGLRKRCPTSVRQLL
jgi:hypothetical protein